MKEIGLYVVKDRAFTPKGIISFTLGNHSFPVIFTEKLKFQGYFL